MGEEDVEPTFPCKVCGRRFIRSSLDKHQPVCKKITNLNRKPFDSGKQRAQNSDITYADVKRAVKEKEKVGGVFPRPQTNWRQRHEHFIDAVSSSKKVDYAIKTGAPLPPPPKTAVPNDYVQCEYCGRNFNQRAAERHIPFCRDQNKSRGGFKPPTTAKSLTANRPPTKRISHRDSSPTRAETRGRIETRGSTKSEDLTHRRRSLDTRGMVQSRQSPSRTTTQSATQPRHGMPPTPNKRSNSAPRTPAASRLKTPMTVSHPSRRHIPV